MTLESAVDGLLRTTADNLQRISGTSYATDVARAVGVIERAFSNGRKLLVFGNGGSAADAEHICAELVGRFQCDRNGLAAIALTTNPALLTAWSNDKAFADVFARQVEALGQRGDVAWGISTSGTSSNVVRALGRAKELGLETLGLTGAGGGEMARYCDVLMAVPLTDTPRIQEVHLVTYHAICALLEQRLFDAPRAPASSQ